MLQYNFIIYITDMKNQKKVNEISAAVAKVFSVTKKKPVKKALKQSKVKKENRSVTPPKAKPKQKSFGQLRKLMKNIK